MVPFRCTCTHFAFVSSGTTLSSTESIALFNNMQSLGYWFIDGASQIVVDPDSHHRWLLLSLFTSSEGHPILVGYCFLYIFTNPFTSPAYSLRLCQILILPPFQKQGHSSHFFDVVYSILLHHAPSTYLPDAYPCEEDRKEECNYYMFTVEDPCEEFTFVRDVYDCRLLKQNELMQSYVQSEPIRDWKEEDLEQIRRMLGLIPSQVNKCYQILLHQRYRDKESKEYRLYVGPSR